MQMYIFVANKFKNSNLIFHFIITITPRQCNLHYVTTLNLQEVSSQAKFKLFLLISECHTCNSLKRRQHNRNPYCDQITLISRGLIHGQNDWWGMMRKEEGCPCLWTAFLKTEFIFSCSVPLSLQNWHCNAGMSLSYGKEPLSWLLAYRGLIQASGRQLMVVRIKFRWPRLISEVPWFNNSCLFQQRLRTVSGKAPIFLFFFFFLCFFGWYKQNRSRTWLELRWPVWASRMQNAKLGKEVKSGSHRPTVRCQRHHCNVIFPVIFNFHAITIVKR